MKKTIINSSKAPAPIGPYSQAVKINGMLFISGQIALIPGASELNNADIATETKQVMDNLRNILEAASFSFDQVVKTTIYLKEMSFFNQVNEVYGSYFSADHPARETVAVKGLPKDVNVEISMIAVA